ncbi:MAG: C40 family peptidase [Bacteroidia bacterium]|nr:C40 family peptidase [Bacteroidia bacterium]
MEKFKEAEKLIIFAKQFIGYPYLWGGTSAKAMDCSGFTKTIYFTGGIILARDASQQFLHGVKVDVSSSLSNLQPGDLVYIGRLNKEGKERITHTGMYIGNTEVIHSSGLVSINSLDSTRSNYSSYLGKGLRGARRIIGADPGKGTEPVGLNNWYKSQK